MIRTGDFPVSGISFTGITLCESKEIQPTVNQGSGSVSVPFISFLIHGKPAKNKD